MKILEYVSDEFRNSCKEVIDEFLKNSKEAIELATSKKEFLDEIRSKAWHFLVKF